MGEESPTEDEFRFQTVGEQLKVERERQGLSLSDVAARTRVPMRHLDSIERADFSALPGTTYSLGFARSYASALGLDPTKTSNDMREELAQGGHQSYQAPTQNYEPADPSRVPSRTLAWTAAALGVLVVAGYLFWRSMMLGDAPAVAVREEAPVATSVASKTQPAATTQSVATGGEVVLTATGSVWVKIYDADNKPLFESEMTAGDKFTVPRDANNPMIVTGRPNAIGITVGGKPVPTLGPAERTVVDVGVSAASLLARKPAANDGAPSEAATKSATQ